MRDPVAASGRAGAGVHHYLVDQDQGGRSVALLPVDELDEEGFGGGRVALLVEVVGVKEAQAVGTCELEGEHAPRVLQGPSLAVRAAHVLDPLLHVDLVEAERGGGGPREGVVGVFAELVDGGEVGEGGGVVEEVVQRDEGVGFAAP